MHCRSNVHGCVALLGTRLRVDVGMRWSGWCAWAVRSFSWCLRPRYYLYPHRMLGRGARAATYAARGTDRLQYCVKVQAQRTRALLHEAAVLRHLQGITGVPSVVAAGPAGDLHAVVTDVIGKSLPRWLLEQAPSSRPTLALKAFRVLLRTLKLVHSRGVLHRDLKPGHFVRTSAGHWFIIDFGSAFCSAVPTSKDRGYASTPQFAPPRVAAGITSVSGYTALDDLQALVCCFAPFVQVAEGRLARVAGVHWGL